MDTLQGCIRLTERMAEIINKKEYQILYSVGGGNQVRSKVKDSRSER